MSDSIEEIRKFHYLRGCLKAEALKNNSVIRIHQFIERGCQILESLNSVKSVNSNSTNFKQNSFQLQNQIISHRKRTFNKFTKCRFNKLD